MKVFFSQYSYSIIKMFVNQFAISIFGSVLAMATASSGNDTLTLIVSIFSILFYLFLLYTMTWEIGAKDKISVDVGKKPYRPNTGLYMSLVANIPNFFIALLYTIAYPLMSKGGFLSGVAAFSKIASIIIEGMYLGTTSIITIGNTALSTYWWSYFLIIIPALFTSWLSYFLGHRNFRFFGAITQKKNIHEKK